MFKTQNKHLKNYRKVVISILCSKIHDIRFIGLEPEILRTGSSETRLGNLLHYGQLFKACGIIYFAQITHILIQFL